jgi:polyhydroxyalkanoate synthesis regulator phasin
VESSGRSGDRSLQEPLRAAVERTLAATAGSASVTRGRAHELLSDVARRGQGAREASAPVTTRVVEAIQGMRLASGEEVRALDEQLAANQRRVADLEQRWSDGPVPSPKPQVEGQ